MKAFGRGRAYFLQNNQLHIEPWDEYEHCSTDVRYVMENILQTTRNETKSYQSIQDQFNTSILAFCECKKRSENLCDNENCQHGNNYIVHRNDEMGELVLNRNRISLDVLYECTSICSCPTYCYNRLVQFGPRKHLKIINCFDDGKGWGLSSMKPIPLGGFICEYAGEIISKEESTIRHQSNDMLKQNNYIIRLNEYSCTDDQFESNTQCIQTFIDAGYISNIGRYLNHSCDPNCELISVRVDCLIPKICIFAKRDIDANEELCFSYGERSSTSDQINTISPSTSSDQLNGIKKCECGSLSCRKYLPNL